MRSAVELSAQTRRVGDLTAVWQSVSWPDLDSRPPEALYSFHWTRRSSRVFQLPSEWPGFTTCRIATADRPVASVEFVSIPTDLGAWWLYYFFVNTVDKVTEIARTGNKYCMNTRPLCPPLPLISPQFLFTPYYKVFFYYWTDFLIKYNIIQL